MNSLLWSRGDLEKIADWISEDSPRRALSFLEEIREAFRRIGEGPLHYQRRPEVGDEARVAVVGRYVILFRITAGEVVRVERVVYGARDCQGSCKNLNEATCVRRFRNMRK